jgi:hypothetical protein
MLTPDTPRARSPTLHELLMTMSRREQDRQSSCVRADQMAGLLIVVLGLLIVSALKLDAALAAVIACK